VRVEDCYQRGLKRSSPHTEISKVMRRLRINPNISHLLFKNSVRATRPQMAFPGNVFSLAYGDRDDPQRKSLTAASTLYKAENTNLNSSLTCQRPPQDGAQPGAATLCDDNRASATSLTKHNTPTLLLQTHHHRSHPPHARRCHLSRVTPAKAVSCCLEASKGLAHDPWNKWEYYRIF
jgi:hypothetical protein